MFHESRQYAARHLQPLLIEFGENASILLEQEIAFTSLMLREEASGIRRFLIGVCLLTSLGLAGSILLGMAATEGMAATFPNLPRWVSFLSVGTIFLAGAFVVLFRLRLLAQQIGSNGDRILTHLEDNIRWLKNIWQ